MPGSAHEYSRAGYNLILLFPIIGLGVIDQDVPAPALLKFPQLYAVGQVGRQTAAAAAVVGRHAVPPQMPRKAPRAATASVGPASHRSIRPGGECS